ncbi:MAG: cobyrinate a,c-diamide synthase [Cyanobacteria bacterium P01_D01_bin.105]
MSTTGIILAGDRSGTGKTTLTLALLAALTKRGQHVQSFKVGPDYIDPMFHAKVTGRPCYNLDPLLTSERYVKESFCTRSAGTDYAVIEGVMGLFDGASGVDDTASTAHIARLLNLPVVLVVDCGRMSRSLAALVQGYRDFDPQVNVIGVVLNRVGSDRHLQLLTNALNAINMPVLGVFRREKDIQLPDRHLGLVPAGELVGFEKIAARLATLGERCFNWTALEMSASQFQHRDIITKASDRPAPDRPAPDRDLAAINRSRVTGKKQTVRIAIARDAAFNFYYPDNLEILKNQGAELIFWSPMHAKTLPESDGLYFGGGFPEVFAAELSQNLTIRTAVKQAIEQGTPTYAECGGLMYLSQTLIDFNGHAWPMVNSIAQTVKMGGKLSLGYRRAEALQAGPLLKKGQIIVGHEFHRSSVVSEIVSGIASDREAMRSYPAYRTQRYWNAERKPTNEGYQQGNLHASYVHIHFGGRDAIAQKFIASCRRG